MKLLLLTPYPHNQAPSQRFRFEQYLCYLKQNNIQINQSSFLDIKTWNVLYSSKNNSKKTLGIFKGLLKRFLLLFTLHKYNLIFIHREACPIGPIFFELIIAKILRKKVIFDFDDAIWLHDVSEANGKVGWLKSPQKTGKIIKYASAITAGNNYLANYAKQFNPNVKIIPTTIDTSYHNFSKSYHTEIITIGWTGTATTIKHFEIAIPILKQLKSKYKDKINFLLISNKSSDCKDIEIEFIPWNKETEIEDLAKIDIGIMPLSDDKWAKGKCGFKGLQYMSLGIPTIMSPVGVNCEIIEDGVNGYLAHSDEEWIEKISQLIESSELREKLGKKGKETIEQRYSVESQKNVYLELFREVAKGNC